MARAVLGTEGGTYVVIRDARPATEGFGDFVVELHSSGLDVEVGVLVNDGIGGSLDAFFEEICSAWRGWQGVKRWEALEGELAVEVARVGAHNEIRYLVSEGHPPLWTATLALLVEPGEEMSHLASDVAEALAALRR